MHAARLAERENITLKTLSCSNGCSNILLTCKDYKENREVEVEEVEDCSSRMMGCSSDEVPLVVFLRARNHSFVLADPWQC